MCTNTSAGIERSILDAAAAFVSSNAEVMSGPLNFAKMSSSPLTANAAS